MKSLIKVILLLLLPVLVLFTTCDNSIGLGALVNTEKPEIKNAGDDNLPGSFLEGTNNPIKLDVNNSLGFEIKTVEMEVEYKDKDTGFLERKKVPAYKDEEGNWVVDLDVSDMQDGKISAWVTAVDESGNKTTSTEIVYFVKNSLPQIKLTIPNESEDNFDSAEYLENIVLNDQIYQGLDIMGLATDDFKIEEGWPKIMFWPSNMNPLELDIDGIPLETDLKNGSWRTVVMPSNHSSTATKFSWPLVHLIQDPNAPDGTGYRLPVPDTTDPYRYLETAQKYRFRIWIRDGFGKDNFYPDRIDNKRGENGTAADRSTAPKKYIEVTHMMVGDKPIVQVPYPKRYYNVVGDFVVDFQVIAGETFDYNDDCVEGWITDKNDGTGLPIGPIIKAVKNGAPKSPYIYQLTFSEEQAKTWTPPANGMLFVAIKATNMNNETGPTDYQNFTLDLDPPVVVIDQPNLLTNKFKSGAIRGGNYTILYPPAYSDSTTRPNWKTATVTVGGTCEDAIQIDKVYYHIGKVPSSDDKTTDLSTFYDDDNFPWKDTGLGTATTADNWSGSVYAWKYTDKYPIGYKSAHSTLVQDLSELGFTTNASWDKDYGTTGEDAERFYLPFYIKVVDVAGNRQIVHYKLSIDPVLDKPQVTIIYPAEGKTVGGTVRITGSAEDNFWMHKVLMRIHKNGDGNNNPNNPAYYYIPTNIPPYSAFYPIYPNYPAPMNGLVRDEDGWFEVTSVGDGPTVNWTATVNGDGKLNPDSGDTVSVKVEVVAIDVLNGDSTHMFPNTSVGPIETRFVDFSSKVPTIENVKVTTSGNTVDYMDGISAAGNFTIQMTISANKGINLLSAKINTSPQVNLLIIGNTPQPIDGTIWHLTPITTVGDKSVTTLTITVDSTKDGIVTGLGYGKTGIMNLEITATDMTESNFSTTNNFRIGIDNFYPYAEVLTPLMAYDELSTETNGVSKYFLVQGTANDTNATSGSIQGLERMLVWFEKAKITYTDTTTWTGRKVEGTQAMLKPDGTTATTSDFQEHKNVMDTTKLVYNPSPKPGETDNGIRAPNTPTGFMIPKLTYNTTIQRWTSTAGMVIDKAENDPESDFDGDGTYGEMWNGLTTITWGARMFITKKTNPTTVVTNFPDGPYIVHYLLMDQAGNATYYQKDIFIENNKPRITQINIGTDINFDNNISIWNSANAPGEYRKNAYIIDNSSESRGTQVTPDSDFRIRNKMFGVRLTFEKGTGQKQAVISYVTEGAEISVSNMEKGKVYKISTTGDGTDFTKYGAPNGYTNTVFVATCSGVGPGRVIPYNTVTGAEQRFSNLGVSSTTATCIFTNFSAGVTDNKTGLFLVKVYDTVVSSPNYGTPNMEFDQLAHAVLLTVSVNNTDTDPPQIAVANFGRRYLPSATGNAENYDENALTTINTAVYTDYIDTTGGTKNGYVQYQAHTTANTNAGSDSDNPTTANLKGGTAYISGKVIFNGKVNDNHRINRITVQIQNNANNANLYGGGEFNIATRDDTTKLLKSADTNITGEREFRLVYKETDVPQYSLAYGHTLVWQFMWDSSKITNVTLNNVNITFRVYDETSTNATATTTIKNVNIVPYISEIRTQLSTAYSAIPSAFNRSAKGWYPVHEDEVITIKGFNLYGGTGDPTVEVRPNANDASGATGVTTLRTQGVNGGAGTSHSATTIYARVDDDAINNNYNAIVSGYLVVRVNNIDSINNTNNNNLAYNKEGNGLNNDTLTDDRALYVWNTGSWLINGGTAPAVTTFFNPFMRMDQNANRLLSYGYYPSNTNGRLRVDKNGTNYDMANANQNRMTNTTVAVSSQGAFYAAGSDITAGGQPFYFAWSNAAGSAYSGRQSLGNLGSDSNQFKIPRIAVQSTRAGTRQDSNGDRIYMSHFDTSNSQVILRVGGVGATTQNNVNTAITIASDNTKYAGSIYTAVGYLNYNYNGLPVIAWYDRLNQKLIFSWGENFTSSTQFDNAAFRNFGTTDWQGKAVEIASDKGAHVDMAVDGGNNIHLAYYDMLNGGLWYTYIPVTGTTTNQRPDVNNRTTVKVDTYLSAGTKLMINVRQENGRYVPYISYAHASFAETKNSVRVAWLTTTTPQDGTDDKDSFTGTWEVMTVPVTGVTPLTDEFVCNGVPTQVSGWNTQVTGTTTQLRGYFNGAAANATNLINRSIIVGYMTDKGYEGAVLKRQLY